MGEHLEVVPVVVGALGVVSNNNGSVAENSLVRHS